MLHKVSNTRFTHLTITMHAIKFLLDSPEWHSNFGNV